MDVIWLADEGSPHTQRWLAAVQKQGVNVSVFSIRKRRPRILYLIDWVVIYLRLRQRKACIVHAHFVSSYGVISSFLSSRFLKIVSIWGSDILLTPHKNRIYFAVIKRALEKADIRIANSAYLAEAAKNVADQPYLTIPFGLDIEQFPFHLKKYVRLDKKPFSITIVKRLHHVAGVDLLIKAFSEVIALASMQDLDLRLNIVGAGEEEAALRTLSDKLGLASSIVWHGWLSSSQVMKVYESTHLAVYPSRVEGLGVSVLESMACGTPVLATRQGGIVELIGENEERGCLVHQGKSALVESIAQSILNYDELVEKTKLARLFIEQKYDISKNAAELVEVYTRLAQKR